VELSARGCLVSTSQRIAPGAILDLRIDLEDGPFAAKARVADSAIDGSRLSDEAVRYLIGLHFLDIRAPDEQRLLRYLASTERLGSHTARRDR
jgi:hypothetical protein